jgi:LacI family transcriptional regulator
MTAEGCIVWGNFSEAFYKNLETGNRGIAIVGYSRRVPLRNSVSLLVDNRGSMCRVVEYLVARNHRQIGLVAHLTRAGHHFERYQGFVESMKTFDCPIREEWIDHLKEGESGQGGVRAGYRATLRILSGKTRPTSIIYGSDLLAYGGMEAIRERGLSIPADVGVVGFDDLPLSQDMFPPLTTMRLDTSELSKVLVDAMERLLLGRGAEPEIVISRTLIERESVAVRSNGG